MVFPLSKFPAAMASWLELLPTAALAEGLRAALTRGALFPGKDLLVLAAWAAVALVAAARTFRWE